MKVFVRGFVEVAVYICRRLTLAALAKGNGRHSSGAFFALLKGLNG